MSALTSEAVERIILDCVWPDEEAEGWTTHLLRPERELQKRRLMEIAYAGEAYESFQSAVELICKSFERSGIYYMTEITLAESDDPPFDAWLVGGASGESEWGDEVRVIRCKEDGEIEPNGPVESVRIERIYIY